MRTATGTKLPGRDWGRHLRSFLLLVAAVLVLWGCKESVAPVAQEPEEEEEQPFVLTETYTTAEDWNSGTIVNLDSESVPGQLQLPEPGEVQNRPIMWIANASEDSLSRWNTDTNREEARYHTWFGALANHSIWDGPAPSRTATDLNGNCYVANRHFDGRPADVIKVFANDWIDRNQNGVMDTSQDLNGDGAISPSEMLPMTDLNGNGRIDDNEIVDERIAWAASVGTPGGVGRSCAIDLEGNIWLGLFYTQEYYKLSGEDGTLLAGPIYVYGHSPYGALVDSSGILWGASLGYTLLRLDTNTLDVSVLPHSDADYGIALGFDDQGCTHVYKASQSGRTYMEFNACTETFSTPAEVYYYSLGVAADLAGDLFVSESNTGGVRKFDAEGNLLWTATPQVFTESRGTLVDSSQNVWLVHKDSNRLSKFSGVDGSPLGTVVTGRGPYTYSDATGLSLFSAAANQGSWKTVLDTRVPTSMWGVVSWGSSEPAGTSISVQVRSSRDGATWSTAETAVNGVRLSSTPMGQYLEIQVSLRRTDQDVTPVLYDLTARTLPTPVP